MNEVLENIWNWIDLYSWTLVAILLIILSIIFIVCEISLTVSQKKVNKKKIEGIEQEIYQNGVKIEFNPNFEKGIKTYIPRDEKGRFTKRK